MAAFIHAMNFTKDKNSKMRDHLFSIFILLPAARYPGLIIHLNCMRKTLIPLRILSTQYAHTSASGQHNGIMMFMSNSPLNHFVKSFCKYKPNLPIISGKRSAQRRIRCGAIETTVFSCSSCASQWFPIWGKIHPAMSIKTTKILSLLDIISDLGKRMIKPNIIFSLFPNAVSTSSSERDLRFLSLIL